MPPTNSSPPAPDDCTLEISEELSDFPDLDAVSPPATFIKRFKDILASDQPGGWDRFTQALEDFMLYINVFNNIPAPRPHSASRKANPRNTSYMQRFYERNRRRAVRIIMGDSEGTCEVDPDSLAEHFFPDFNFIPEDDLFSIFTKADTQVNSSSFSPEEVCFKLSKTENIAPGPDRITFQQWKRVDPDAKALACIFNLCLKYLKIPNSWKESRTVFIPKNGGGPCSH